MLNNRLLAIRFFNGISAGFNSGNNFGFAKKLNMHDLGVYL
ncbi:hypothetical protein [Oceanirhabdus sp. W0125-5]|nr:hypothetical protein [Oceanirhabdus sp. W0125-5]WBW96356.1 hypothetical protein OW730_22070 [Oceanirhabdus sp. W0125-5]